MPAEASVAQALPDQPTFIAMLQKTQRNGANDCAII